MLSHTGGWSKSTGHARFYKYTNTIESSAER